ncbi:hypothetical protein [Chondromyces apiculatus]|uniref:Uncharacterized protein n=1 Tax=Chondromyces apiculatus DSM 436 TaxID=1192034 RepID=A0A017T3Y9_9BACT|nr:hypothetical protein [Chondromyces apiculatus]EYF03964.1 Hypothetical protein CAP_5065 [Chondromyces apiculatus DSM 436]
MNFLLLTTALCALLLGGCNEDGKVAQQYATDITAKMAPILRTDVEQVRRGLPSGAKKVGEMVDTDPGADLVGLRKALESARASDKDLQVAKVTFFSFADPAGMILRSEADPDLLANKSVAATFPELKKAVEPGSGLVEVFGQMQEMRGVRNGPDEQWVVAYPVKAADGQAKGMLVAGWSFRAYAYRLQEAARREAVTIAERDKLKLAPLLYAFVFKGPKVYAQAVTPDVNTEAVEKLDPVGKTASGPWSGTMELTGRTFGAAALRVPELAPDAGVVVLASPI